MPEIKSKTQNKTVWNKAENHKVQNLSTTNPKNNQVQNTGQDRSVNQVQSRQRTNIKTI